MNVFFCASNQHFYEFPNSCSWFVNICIGFTSHGLPLKYGRTYFINTNGCKPYTNWYSAYYITTLSIILYAMILACEQVNLKDFFWIYLTKSIKYLMMWKNILSMDKMWRVENFRNIGMDERIIWVKVYISH